MTVEEISHRLNQPGIQKPGGNRWLFNLERSPDQRLDEQLASAADFLTENIEALRDIARTCPVDIHIGWTPIKPQDGVRFTRRLLDLLDQLNADILIDTYTD
nr:hypothetical protein [Kibdelosporangium sp. MJ126-NF4]